jgi:hypothetical protein
MTPAKKPKPRVRTLASETFVDGKGRKQKRYTVRHRSGRSLQPGRFGAVPPHYFIWDMLRGDVLLLPSPGRTYYWRIFRTKITAQRFLQTTSVERYKISRVESTLDLGAA